MPPQVRRLFFAFITLLFLGAGKGWSQTYTGDKLPVSPQAEFATKKHRTVDNTDGDVDENPRQRRRVLDKRNPLATEYQSIGDIGNVMLSDIDSEGVNNRARFPFEDPFVGPRRTVSGQIFYNYSDLSGNGFLQGKSSYRQVLGKERRWAVSINAERTGVDHAFERSGIRWRVRKFGGQEYFFLDRLRLSRKVIRTVRNKAVFSLDHQLGERHKMYFKTHIEDRDDQETDQRMRMAIGQGEVVFLDPQSAVVRDAASERSIRDISQHRKVFRFLIGGNVDGDGAHFDYSVYSSRWQLQEKGNLNPIFRMEGVDYEYSLADPAFPAVSVLNGRDLSDPAGFLFEEYTLRVVDTVDEDIAVQVNYEKRMKLGSLSGILRTGAVHRSKQRTNVNEQLVVDGFGGDFSLDKVAGEDPGTVMRDTYPLGRGVDPDAFREFEEVERGRFHFNPGRTRIESDTSNYQAWEDVTGAYILSGVAGQRWELKGGIRFERTSLETSGNIVLTDGEGEYVATEPVSGGIEYTKWLPSVEFDYSLNDRTNLSAAWFRTLARPDYFDLVPYRRIYANFEFISEGNPNLRPTMFDNFVASVHLENELVGNLSVAAYYKKLEAFFYDSTVFIEGGPYDGWRRRRNENGNRASLWGVELGWKRKVDFLSAILGDLTLTAFYTLSETTADVDHRPGEVLALPERAGHFASLAANHKLGRLESVFALTYQGSFLDDIGSDATLDEIMVEAVRINLAFNLRLSERVNTYVKYSNLFDRPERSYEGDPTRIKDNQYGSWKIETGIRFKL